MVRTSSFMSLMSFISWLSLSSLNATAADGTLFTYKGQDYSANTLPLKLQQSLYELQAEYQQRVADLADTAVLDLHFAAEEKRTGKSREDVEAAAFKTSEPSEKELKDWYEANKTRLPPNYNFEQIKGDIKNLLKTEQQNKQRRALTDKLKKEGKFALKVAAPEAPLVSIATDNYPRKGEAKPKVTIVEFADYLCPHCKHAAETLDKVLKKYPRDVQLVYMDFPIRGDQSIEIAKGAYCATAQDKFWEFHDLAFSKNDAGAAAPAALAKELKLDEAKFTACMSDVKAAKHVAASKAEGERLGVSGTPTIFINGRRLRSPDEAVIVEEIEKVLKAGRS